MSKLISVLIVDDNASLSKIIKEYLDKTDDIFVKAIAKDGIEAIKMISEISPDAVVLDLIMPNLDGIGVLESIAKSGKEKRPVVIALTAIGNDAIVQKAMQLGADYYMMKPFDVEILASHIRRLYMEKVHVTKKRKPVSPDLAETRAENSHNKAKESLEEIVTDLIIKMGITPNISGYYYLREAVLLSIDRPTMLNCVSKFIYPVLAENHKTTARNIDKAIKAAIESISKKSKNCDSKNSNPVFLINSGGRLSNAQIIMLLAEKAIQRLNHG